jgi:dextranase
MPKYKHLKDIVDQNAKLSQNRLNTVLAAYMNYDLASQPGEFNAPGVLLTDAVIFASGGSHIELGESMLGKEYFPNRNLRVTPALEQQLIRYYDFLTAYQNVLRDGVQESDTNVTAGAGLQLSKTPEQGKVWMIAKRKDNLELVHLINFTDANSLDWRDLKGTQSEPSLKEHIPLAIQVPSGRKVKGVWTASPDVHGGSPIRLAFKQEGGVLTFTIPQLKYWDMAVMEYE